MVNTFTKVVVIGTKLGTLDHFLQLEEIMVGFPICISWS